MAILAHLGIGLQFRPICYLQVNSYDFKWQGCDHPTIDYYLVTMIPHASDLYAV